MCWSRTAPHVVTQRQELLHTCLQDLLTLNPQGPALSPLLAFLDPSLITCPMETPVDSTLVQQASVSTQQPAHNSISASSENEKHGSRMRLLTDAPVRFTDKELMLRQQGQCAECGKALPAVGISWLGHTSSKAGFLCACITTLLDGCQGLSVHASHHCLMGIRVQVTLVQDLLCMCMLCLAWRRLRQVFYPQFDCQTCMVAYNSTCYRQNSTSCLTNTSSSPLLQLPFCQMQLLLLLPSLVTHPSSLACFKRAINMMTSCCRLLGGVSTQVSCIATAATQVPQPACRLQYYASGTSPPAQFAQWLLSF